MSIDNRQSIRNWMTKYMTPEWVAHQVFMEAGDGDTVLLRVGWGGGGGGGLLKRGAGGLCQVFREAGAGDSVLLRASLFLGGGGLS